LLLLLFIYDYKYIIINYFILTNAKEPRAEVSIDYIKKLSLFISSDRYILTLGEYNQENEFKKYNSVITSE
jgi:hypothetical protein